MSALSAGTKAPTFKLTGLDGENYILTEALKAKSSVLLAFFKVSCPVCQFTFPYLERLHRIYPQQPIWGISQDDSDASIAFNRMFGITFPTLLDQGWELSTAYGLTNVPSIFLVGADLTINRSIVGFVKSDLEALNQELSNFSNIGNKALFTAADEVPELRPG